MLMDMLSYKPENRISIIEICLVLVKANILDIN